MVCPSLDQLFFARYIYHYGQKYQNKISKDKRHLYSLQPKEAKFLIKYVEAAVVVYHQQSSVISQMIY